MSMLKFTQYDLFIRIKLMDNFFSAAIDCYKNRKNHKSPFIYHEGKWAA